MCGRPLFCAAQHVREKNRGHVPIQFSGGSSLRRIGCPDWPGLSRRPDLVSSALAINGDTYHFSLAPLYPRAFGANPAINRWRARSRLSRSTSDPRLSNERAGLPLNLMVQYAPSQPEACSTTCAAPYFGDQRISLTQACQHPLDPVTHGRCRHKPIFPPCDGRLRDTDLLAEPGLAPALPRPTLADPVGQGSTAQPVIMANKLDDRGMVSDARHVLASLPLTHHIDTYAEPTGGGKFGEPFGQPGFAEQPRQSALR